MNIAIAGTRGVGKTSLFRSLKIELPKEYKIYLFEETLFYNVRDTISILDHMRNQEDTLIKHIEAQKWSEKCGFNVMSDGSLIDTLAHMIIGNHSVNGYIFPGDVKENIKILHSLSPFIHEAISRINAYDLIFYLPIEFVCKGLSDEELTHQKKTDIVIREIMALYNIEHHAITGSMDDRISSVLKTITQHIEGK